MNREFLFQGRKGKIKIREQLERNANKLDPLNVRTANRISS